MSSIPVIAIETLKMSGDAIRQNKLRSFLSVLGITIGIFCIISVYSLVHSLEKSLNNQFSKFGADVLFVQKWPWDEFGGDYQWWKYLSRPVTSPQEAQFLEERMSRTKVKSICYVFDHSTDVKHNTDALKSISIRCISQEYAQVQDLKIDYGRYFTPEENRTGQGVAIIGYSIAQSLFPNGNAVGQAIKIGSGICRIVGVCKFEGSSMINNSSDNLVFVPSKWGMGYFSYKQSEDAQIMVKAQPGITLDDLRIEVAQVMRSYRRIKPGQDDNFAVNKMSMITDAISNLFAQIRKIGLIIGAFAMLVGCFGVANIMFVSVKERTQEIGIQKALGAKNWFIRLQFLLESIWLCIAGGIIGIGLVALVLWLLNMAFSETMGEGASLNLSLGDALFGLITSVIVGILSGYIPAVSASKLDPVIAIRAK